MPVQPAAPPLAGPVLSAQSWHNVTFLHWPVDPDSVQGLFPPGVRPDVIDGVTYVGLVPFILRHAGPGARLPVPFFGDFCETNVRLYSVDAADRHGIVFLTLDAQRLATVLLARWSLGLPYAWSSMNSAQDGDERRYQSRRRWPRPARSSGGPTCRVRVRLGETAEPSALQVWLTARWGLHTRVAGRTVWVPNEHPAWSLRSAEVLELDDGLVRSCGIEVDPGAMLPALWSKGVRTSFGMPSVVSQ
ncbi:MAG: uncharacterized protein QOK10_1229 [Pseudonocardiales bacterium]|jgi:uncharacterized protein YqjF (DUF2071 family)|nr:uncharacterized protein [Pseudonocardiales bacterium]